MSDVSSIISDAEVIRVHGHANFGAMTPREVVNDGVRKAAVGYHTGHTQFSILREHGLITKPRGMSYDVNLTKKGKRYARALWNADKDRGDQVEHMVQRFLGWRLPEDFNPDNGISFKATFNDHLPSPTRCNPSGTNLFDARQAKAILYMLDGMKL